MIYIYIYIYFLDTICHIFGMFQFVLIIFRQLLNVNKAYIKVGGLSNTFILLNTFKFVYFMFVGIKFVYSSAELDHKMRIL